MDRVVSVFLWILILLFGTVLLTGYFVGEEYSGKEEIFLDYKAPYVWDILVDYGNVGFSKSDVKSIETIGRFYNLYMWKENLKNGGFRIYKQIFREENKKLTLELKDSSYGVTGTWDFLLKEQREGTLVVIEEKSKNKSILRRGILYYFDQGKETTIWIRCIKIKLFGKLLTTP